uniref:Uncharacterized protein n=1 Tax=viral metagenome TaxID=1070528 RepID=A0A6C0BUX2_9ZZZZ
MLNDFFVANHSESTHKNKKGHGFSDVRNIDDYITALERRRAAHNANGELTNWLGDILRHRTNLG